MVECPGQLREHHQIICFANLPPANGLELGASLLPRVHPALDRLDVVHSPIIAGCASSDSHMEVDAPGLRMAASRAGGCSTWRNLGSRQRALDRFRYSFDTFLTFLGWDRMRTEEPNSSVTNLLHWSGRRDLNTRSPAPKVYFTVLRKTFGNEGSFFQGDPGIPV
jgi:hypothetical protein